MTGLDLTLIEEFLNRMERLEHSVEGDILSVEFWELMHQNPLRNPPLIELFDFDSFGREHKKILEKHTDSLGYIDYSSSTYIIEMRKFFWEHANTYLVTASSSAQVSAQAPRRRELISSLRLYSWLPIRIPGCNDSHFFPIAALPAKQWIKQRAADAGKGIPPGKNVTYLASTNELHFFRD